MLSVNLIPSDSIAILQYGESYSLNCTINGSTVSTTSVQVSWYRNGMIIDTVIPILTIDYTSPESVNDGGSYKCIVNGDDESSTGESESVLIVMSSHIIQDPSNVQTLANRSIQFTCNATGYPLPTIEWRRVSIDNNFTSLQALENVTVDLPNNITNNSISSVNMTEIYSVLTLQSVNYDDFGYYLCIATLSLDVLLNDSNITLMDCSSISSTATLAGNKHYIIISFFAFYYSTFISFSSIKCTS